MGRVAEAGERVKLGEADLGVEVEVAAAKVAAATVVACAAASGVVEMVGVGSVPGCVEVVGRGALLEVVEGQLAAPLGTWVGHAVVAAREVAASVVGETETEEMVGGGKAD